MNEQLQIALSGILSRATQGIDAGTKFLTEQLPDVIQQLLVWHFAKSLVLFLVPVVFLCLTAILARRVYVVWFKSGYIEARKAAEACYQAYNNVLLSDPRIDELKRTWYAADANAKSKKPNDDIMVTLGVGAGLCAAASFLSLLICANLTWLQIWLAPKLYLIEYAARLAK